MSHCIKDAEKSLYKPWIQAIALWMQLDSCKMSRCLHALSFTVDNVSRLQGLTFHIFPEPFSPESVSLFDGGVIQPVIIAVYCIDFVRLMPLPAKDSTT